MKYMDKFVNWLYRKYMNRNMKKQMEQRKTDEDIKRDNLYKQLRELYNFVEWLNKSFPNRKARKGFWRNVANNESVMEETLMNILKSFPSKKEAKEENKKLLENANKLKEKKENE